MSIDTSPRIQLARASRGGRRVVGALSVAVLSLSVGASRSAAPDPMPGDVKRLNSIHFEQDEDVKCLLSALETGDPAKGPSTFILKAPPGCVVPWHAHTAQEQAMVIDGHVKMEMDGHSPDALGAGGFAVMQSKTAHKFSCTGTSACLLIVTFDRPYDIFWVKR